MAYATVADLRQMQPQIKADNDVDALLEKLLNRATQIIDRLLGFSFTGYTVGSRVVRVYGGEMLQLPPHLGGSVTQVVWAGLSLSDWTAQPDGSLYRAGGWGVATYTVTAQYGYGPVPEDIAEVCIELATNMYHERDRKGYSDAIGVEGGGELRVGYTKALTNRQQMIIDLVKAQYAPVVVV